VFVLAYQQFDGVRLSRWVTLRLVQFSVSGTLPFTRSILRAAMSALLGYRLGCTSHTVIEYFSPRYLQATRIKDGYTSKDVHLQVPCGAIIRFFSLPSSSYT
jgi:hypothetical protein